MTEPQDPRRIDPYEVDLARRRRRAAGPDPMLVIAVLERDDFSCICCGAEVKATPRSVAPRAPELAGSTSPSDHVTLCRRCRLGEDEGVDVGVDVFKGGWVAVALFEGAFESCRAFRSFTEVTEAFGDARTIAVDIPIGLPDVGPRLADVEVRSYVRPRSSSVFTTPPRRAVEAESYPEAAQTCRELTGKSLSRQSFALAKRILEVDVIAAADPRIKEVHPEASFRTMNKAPVLHAKKTWSGAALRRRLLGDHGIALPDDLRGAGHVPIDDVLDAAAAAWSAHRITKGVADSYPDPPERDGRGLEMAIWV